MDRRHQRALAGVLALASLLAAAPAGAQSTEPGKPLYDSRSRQPVRPAAPTDAAAVRARDRLNAQLGRQGVVDVDARTGTPRMIGRLDGFLTGPSGDDPAQIALDYVRAQRDVFGLREDDLAALRPVRRYSDASGTTYLIWAQTWRGLMAWDNELRAAVTADGRLVNVGGSPLPGLGTRTAEPELTASQALSEALADAGRRRVAPRATPRGGADRRTSFTGGHEARLVLFTERRGDVHLAWNVTDQAGPAEVYDHLIDARTGDVLYRANRVKGAAGHVHAFEYAPDKDSQGARPVDVTDGTDLRGPSAHAYVDLNGDHQPDGVTAADSGTDWTDVFMNQCTLPEICSWGPGVDANDERQSAAQAYYFVNNFHDWLRDEVGFTAASGGFEGTDPVRAEVLHGFSTGRRNNAFMSTPPDGQSPTMSMFVWTSPDRNGADDATVVYHEYTHGLSNRLVTRPNGVGALSAAQSGAMGEGWSDWYAMDYLVDKLLQADTGVHGEIAIGGYSTGAPTGVRRANLDCPVDDNSSNCTSAEDTYGDVAGRSVHDDGEIWAQTLWDLRRQIGGSAARRIVTDGMRLSPDDPSFLDMRNAILQADQIAFGGANRGAIWAAFAHRGMGFGAFTRDGNDAAPRESFLPPPSGAGLTVTGRVTDANTGAPIKDALVQLASPLPGDPTGRTDANGNYSIAGMVAGTYPNVVVTAPGYEVVVRSATLSATSPQLDQKLRRNFAASSSGASIAGFTGPDFTGDGCGPGHLIDNELRTGWGSTAHNHPTTAAAGEKSATIALPTAVDVSAFRIDPGAVCGDDDSASTAGFRVDTSADGQTFTEAAAGTFSSADNHRLNEIAAGAGGVRFVRFTMRSPQRQRSDDSGRLFMDAAELQVIGTPTPPPAPAPSEPPPPEPAPGPGPPPTLDLTAPIAKLSLKPRQRVKTALSRGLKISVACDERCSGSFTATLDAKTAKRAKLLKRRSRARSVKVAAGRIRLGAGKRSVKLRFSRKAKRRLKRQRRLKLAISGTVSDTAGNKRLTRTKIALRR